MEPEKRVVAVLTGYPLFFIKGLYVQYLSTNLTTNTIEATNLVVHIVFSSCVGGTSGNVFSLWRCHRALIFDSKTAKISSIDAGNPQQLR